MARNIVICCDGTNNEFGEENTNVVRLIQSLDRTPGKQLLYYDPGIGTLPEPSTIMAVQKWTRKVIELAFGAGLIPKVLEAYSFLMNYWEPGDQVFLFGFSRGSYTVRVLAGMLHQMGLLPHGSSNMLPYAVRLYKSIRNAVPDSSNKYWKLCNQFRWTFAREVPGNDQRHFPVHFLGLWDTVSSVGWIWEPKTFPFTGHNPSIQNIWHAVSIDERRAFFRSNLVKKDRNNPTQILEQHWFAGDHSDIGGGHGDKEGGLWRCAFEWLVEGAYNTGLLLDAGRLQRVLSHAPAKPWAEKKHDLLAKWWKVAEYIPKKRWNAVEKKYQYRCNHFQSRRIGNGAVIHQTVLLRLRDQALAYRPPNFSSEFIQYVLDMPNVPDSLTYRHSIPLPPVQVLSPNVRRQLFPLTNATLG